MMDIPAPQTPRLLSLSPGLTQAGASSFSGVLLDQRVGELVTSAVTIATHFARFLSMPCASVARSAWADPNKREVQDTPAR
jgi:hypothetical protein